MTKAFLVLISLIALLPVLLMIDGDLARGAVCGVLAIAMLGLGLSLHPGDLSRFSRLLRPTAFVIVFLPAIWMLLQVLPAGRSLANPVWASASVALEKPFVGAVSLDIGATLLSFASYCAVIAVAFVSAAVTLDRRRADLVLSLLTAVAVLIAIILICSDLGYLGLERAIDRASAVNI